MKNVTITLPDDLSRRARVEAAKAGKSLSRWIADGVEREIGGMTQAEAMEKLLSEPGYSAAARNLPKRDEHHDRPALRPYDRKDEDPRELAVKLSQITGETVTEAVTEALRERLRRERRLQGRKGLAQRLMDIGRHAASLPVLDARHPDEILYDEFGLPK